MVGQNIGKYRVLDRIGRGGMGTVYRAIDETLHRDVAIKVLNAELNDPEVAKRFRAEAITVARLSHPGIATIYELFQHEGQWLMVMEFVRGETLERLVERMGALSPQRTAELCMQALAALAHAHSMGVVHRDLKPANIMITETGAIKIMDFGIARVSGTEHLTSVGFMMGTPAYMAPEQVMGQEIDARADLYAMGVVFYRLTTAKLPFKGDTPFAMAQSQVNDPPTPVGVIRADLPSWVEQVVVRSLAKRPDERFQSAVEFHEAFARCLAGLPMATLYSSSAQTELMMTPPRAMPTAAISMSALGQPAVGPTAQLSGPMATNPDLTVQARTPIAMRSPTATDSAPGTPAVVSTASAPRLTETVPAAAATSKSGASRAWMAAAVVVVLIGTAGLFFVRSRRAAQSSADVPAAADVAAANVPTAPAPEVPAPAFAPSSDTSATPAGGVVPPPVPGALGADGRAAGPTTSSSVARGATLSPGAAVVGSIGRGGVATSANATGRGAAAPPADDTHMAFADARLLVVSGRKTTDEDITVNFISGQVSLLGKKTGSALAGLPYKAITHATFVHARDPRWDPTFASPPDSLDVGGAFRTAKNWLVLQAMDSYLIVRLDDSNWRNVVQTLEARTGLTVERPRPNEK